MIKVLIVGPIYDMEKVFVEDQKRFQSGTGKLLYLVKHSRPGNENVTHELFKAMDDANQEAFLKGQVILCLIQGIFD